MNLKMYYIFNKWLASFRALKTFQLFHGTVSTVHYMGTVETKMHHDYGNYGKYKLLMDIDYTSKENIIEKFLCGYEKRKKGVSIVGLQSTPVLKLLER